MTRIEKVWTKVDDQWKPVEILYKTNDGVWKNVCPSIKDNNEWIKKCEVNFNLGSFTERYLNTFNSLQFKLFEGQLSNGVGGFFPGIPGWTSSTDIENQYSSAGGTFQYINPNPNAYVDNETFIPDNYFNGLHMCLIPKGPHRGKVMMMSDSIVLASGSPYLGTNTVMSFQPVTIADFSKNLAAGQPRFLNFLIPIETSSKYQDISYDPVQEDTAYPNLFCCGHAWSPSGDLVIAAGSRWAFDYGDPEGSYAKGRLLAWNGSYVWNPALAGSWTSSVYTVYGSRTDTHIAFTSGHYLSAGAWVRGPDLHDYRWYPTVLPYPKVSRTNNRNHMLIFGGDTNFRLPSLSTTFDTIPSSYNSYESFQIIRMATSSDPGLIADQHPVTYSYSFSGPSTQTVSSQVYSALEVSNNKTTNLPEYTGNLSIQDSIFNDSLYYYPRCFTTSSGGVCFAGFTHRSSLLYDHDSLPGVWDNTVGNSSSTINAHDYFRWYGSAFRVPNNIDKTKIDDIYRCGGLNSFVADRSAQDTWSVDELKLSNILGVCGANNFIDWSSAGPTMMEARSTFNTVILPDASIFAIGGVQNNPANYLTFNENFVDTVGQAYLNEVSPLLIADHHHFTTGPSPQVFSYGPCGIPYVSSTHTGIDHANEHVDEIYDKYEIAFSTDQQNTLGVFRLFVCPEILNPQRTKWTLNDTTRTISWRDYHSASLLLPDGRILVGGGDNRHSAGNPRLNPLSAEFNSADVPYIFNFYSDLGLPLFYNHGWDYEIYSPHYLIENIRPTGIGLSGATYNNHPQINCHQLSGAGPYIVSSNSISNNGYLNKVVLMAPGNVTHHADVTQRYYECNVELVNNTQIKFTMPNNEKILPLGFYMLFVLTNENIPSEALWVWVM